MQVTMWGNLDQKLYVLIIKNFKSYKCGNAIYWGSGRRIPATTMIYWEKSIALAIHRCTGN